MNKKTAITLTGIVLAVAVLSVSTVMYFRNQNAEFAAASDSGEFSIPEKEENSTPVSVAPIVVEPKEVVKEPEVSEPENDVPPPEVSEATEPDGGVVQTPNWEAQKELAPDTDLNNPDKQPEYVASSKAASSKAETSQAPSSSSAASSKQTGSTPKNGDTKTENGATYVYDKAFGWVKAGNGGTTEHIDAPTTGNKVGK